MDYSLFDGFKNNDFGCTKSIVSEEKINICRLKNGLISIGIFKNGKYSLIELNDENVKHIISLLNDLIPQEDTHSNEQI